MKSCLICDDHSLVRGAIRGAVAGRWPEASIVEAVDFPSSWELAGRKPDLILTDLDMPGAEPRAGVEELLRMSGGAPVIVITGSHDDDLLLDLLSMGVAGFLPKTGEVEVMLAAIALVLAGGRYLPPRVAELLAGKSSDKSNQPSADWHLTDRQLSVLRLVAQGSSNKEIALALGLSPATVKTHVAQVLATIDAKNRTDAASKARLAGLV